jgi:hypothetical protein
MGSIGLNIRTRPFRVIRLFFLIENSRQSRSNFLYYFGLIPKILKIIFFIAIFISSYAIVGIFLFENTVVFDQFSSFPVLCINLFQLLTTVIYPDIALKAWVENKYFSLYFIIFLILGIIFLLNLFFSEVFSSYQEFCKLDFVKKYVKRKSLMSKAFLLLSGKNDTISLSEFDVFVRHIYPSISSRSLRLIKEKLLDTSDYSNIHEIDHDMFLKFLDITEFEIYNKDLAEPTRFSCPTRLMSKALNAYVDYSEKVRFTRFYKFFVFTLILFNASFLYVFALIGSNTALFYVHSVLVFFLVTEFVIELPAWLRSIHRMNSKNIRIILQAAFIICACVTGINSAASLILQSLIVFRVFSFSKETDTRINKIIHSMRYFMVNALFVLMTMYVYAIVGMYLFSGKLSRDNPKLVGTLYSDSNYFSINFESFVESWFTLFHFLIVNNWNVTASGLIASSGMTAVLFPISFNIIVVTIMLDVVITFFLDIQVRYESFFLIFP